MVNLHDLEALISRAENLEITDPREAHARYEVAERRLNEHLVKSHGITIDLINSNAVFSKIYGSYAQRIMQGYARLNSNNQ